MKKQYYFLSGLPRTGTTLLGAILNQNPQIYVGPISPVVDIICSIKYQFSTNTSYTTYKKPSFETDLLKSIPEKWYSDVDKPIIIDKNRAWTRYIKEAELVTDNIKIICTVRSILEILASFIKIINKENTKKSFLDVELYQLKIPITDDARCDYMMSRDGVVERSLYSLAQPFIKGNEHLLHLVDYNDFVNDTELCLKNIYNFLEIDYYKHDLNNIKNEHRENDGVFGIEGLHEVRPVLKQNKYNVEDILSEYVIKKYSNLEFWN